MCASTRPPISPVSALTVSSTGGGFPPIQSGHVGCTNTGCGCVAVLAGAWFRIAVAGSLGLFGPRTSPPKPVTTAYLNCSYGTSEHTFWASLIVAGSRQQLPARPSRGSRDRLRLRLCDHRLRRQDRDRPDLKRVCVRHCVPATAAPHTGTGHRVPGKARTRVTNPASDTP